MNNTLQATLILYFYPERWGDEAAAAQVKAQAETKIGAMLDQLDAEFARHGGPWLLGERFSICDPYAFVLCRWTRGFGRPAREPAAPEAVPGADAGTAGGERAFATEGLKPLV